jgi:hypothetical protein
MTADPKIYPKTFPIVRSKDRPLDPTWDLVETLFWIGLRRHDRCEHLTAVWRDNGLPGGGASVVRLIGAQLVNLSKTDVVLDQSPEQDLLIALFRGDLTATGFPMGREQAEPIPKEAWGALQFVDEVAGHKGSCCAFPNDAERMAYWTELRFDKEGVQDAFRPALGPDPLREVEPWGHRRGEHVNQWFGRPEVRAELAWRCPKGSQAAKARALQKMLDETGGPRREQKYLEQILRELS